MAEEARLIVEAKPESLAEIARFLGQTAARWGLSEQALFDCQLALDEACANIIEHGYSGREGPIELVLRLEASDLTCTLYDRGRSFDPQSIHRYDPGGSAEEKLAGAMGMYLIERLMDEVRYEFDTPLGNRLTFVKRGVFQR